MRTNFILVDLENVQPESLETLNNEHFRVVVFVGANQTKLSFPLAEAIQRFGSRAEYVKISGSGHNALDFHIAFYIGQFAAEHANSFFHIISKDAGFDPLIQHLKTRKILAARVSSIREIPLVKATSSRTAEERTQLVMERLIAPKATRPRTLKTLCSSINSQFQKQLNEAEVKAIVDGLLKSNFIMLLESNVVYNVPLRTTQ